MQTLFLAHQAKHSDIYNEIMKKTNKSFCKFFFYPLKIIKLAYCQICNGKTTQELSDICQNKPRRHLGLRKGKVP